MEAAPTQRRFDVELRSSPDISTLQINLGLVCNLACRHCHVDSSPKRTGTDVNMSERTAERILDWVERNPSIRTVDLTGGSPEMNPRFRPIVRRLRQLGRHVMDRCNPTIVDWEDPKSGASYDWIPEFLAEHRVEVVASMPCYLQENVEGQRGVGSYRRSVDGLLRLNGVGYGIEPDLPLNLVYNPGGPSLPPPEAALAEDYRRELRDRFGLSFTNLWTITNMPIARWRRDLERRGELVDYLELLANSHNPATVAGLMCRHQIHVDSQGRLHDCDFNYALGMRVPDREEAFLWDVSARDLGDRRIATGDHCFGCTAGAGSSCGGALV